MQLKRLFPRCQRQAQDALILAAADLLCLFCPRGWLDLLPVGRTMPRVAQRGARSLRLRLFREMVLGECVVEAPLKLGFTYMPRRPYAQKSHRRHVLCTPQRPDFKHLNAFHQVLKVSSDLPLTPWEHSSASPRKEESYRARALCHELLGRPPHVLGKKCLVG